MPASASLTPTRTWMRTFPAAASQIRHARVFLTAVIPGHPLADDAALCLSDIATNAVMHSNSRQAGGTFTVRITHCPSHLRVEVEDQGGPWTPSQEGDGRRGRGLLIVTQLATAWGTSGGITARAVWFEIGSP